MARKYRKFADTTNCGPFHNGKGARRRDSQDISDSEMTTNWCQSFGCRAGPPDYTHCRNCGQPISPEE